MSDNSEFDLTIDRAEETLNRIRDNQIPAHPKTYEVIYTHLSGANKELSAAIEEMNEKYGRVSPGQILHLHETYISNNSLSDKVDDIGEQITHEASFLESTINKSHGLSQGFGETLSQAASDLEIDLDQETLQKLIKRVSMETLTVKNQNQKLLEQLNTAQIGIKKLHKSLAEVREESLMDQLTMIGNRRHFDRSLASSVKKYQMSIEPLCLVIADIDHFKSFNDKWGHQTGDQVLKLVAMAIKGNVKVIDVPCRYGGEEFAMILPNTTLEQGKTVANRIRMAVAKRDVVKRSTSENLGKITISAGVALLRPGDTPESLINRADRSLYNAKDAGRNQVITENDIAANKVA
ncbi:MAG: diguanylate cyclase [Hyphomicrobiales bacterium]